MKYIIIIFSLFISSCMNSNYSYSDCRIDRGYQGYYKVNEKIISGLETSDDECTYSLVNRKISYINWPKVWNKNKLNMGDSIYLGLNNDCK